MDLQVPKLMMMDKCLAYTYLQVSDITFDGLCVVIYLISGLCLVSACQLFNKKQTFFVTYLPTIYCILYCMQKYSIKTDSLRKSDLEMNALGPNHRFVVLGACLLWLISLFAIAWSLLLFFCVGDILLLTGTDLVNAFVLLSGIIMLPTNISMLCAIANGKTIDHKAKVVCCPLWLSIVWIIIVNVAAAVVCIMKIWTCNELTSKYLSNGLKHYRSVPKFKHFIDDLQWSLKCCGVYSYKDWFSHDWYDKIRDYEWDPSMKTRNYLNRRSTLVTDSVPLSCCKSGSCISNYLMELGTHSINTTGCGPLMYRIVMISMSVHLAMFIIIVITEILMLKFIMANKNQVQKIKIRRKTDVRHIMSVKDNFNASSGSCLLNLEDCEEDEQLLADGNTN